MLSRAKGCKAKPARFSGVLPSLRSPGAVQGTHPPAIRATGRAKVLPGARRIVREPARAPCPASNRRPGAAVEAGPVERAGSGVRKRGGNAGAGGGGWRIGSRDRPLYGGGVRAPNRAAAAGLFV